jgi:hypothetical protein
MLTTAWTSQFALTGCVVKLAAQVRVPTRDLPVEQPIKFEFAINIGCVEVQALTTDDDADIEGFLRRKRQWLFDTVREMGPWPAGRLYLAS